MEESTKNAPTPERLRGLFEYNAKTGILRWRRRPPGDFKTKASFMSWNARLSGRVAGTADSDGYLQIRIGTKRYRVHRVVWAMRHGVWPTGEIDHRDGDITNNRIKNLRDVTTSVNQQNQRRPHADGTSGYLGVCWHKLTSRWMASISIGGRVRYLGLFDTPEAASGAYLEAKRRGHEGCTI